MIVEIISLVIIISVFFFGRKVGSWVPDEPEEGGQLMMIIRDISFMSATALLGLLGLLLLLVIVVFRKHYERTYPFIGLVVLVASSTTNIMYGQIAIISLLVLTFFVQGVLSFGKVTRKPRKKT